MSCFQGNARTNDRFIGLPCGCVVIVRGYEMVAAKFNPAHVAQADYMFACRMADDQFPAARMADFAAANVYFECEAIKEPSADGIRWQ